jgi:hypothetical protein
VGSVCLYCERGIFGNLQSLNMFLCFQYCFKCCPSYEGPDVVCVCYSVELFHILGIYVHRGCDREHFSLIFVTRMIYVHFM